MYTLLLTKLLNYDKIITDLFMEENINYQFKK